MAKAKSKTTVDISIDDLTINKIAGDISSVLGDDQDAKDSLAAAKDKASKSQISSIKGLADKLHGINTKLNSADVEKIADVAADKIASGNAQVKKARKTEIKLMLETRQHIKAVVDGVEKLIAGGATVNLRTKSLALLRDLRKDPTKTPKALLDAEKVALTAPGPSEEAKALTALEKLRESKALRDDNGDLDIRAERLIKKLEALARGEELDEAEDDPEPEAEPAPPAPGEIDESMLGFSLEELLGDKD